MRLFAVYSIAVATLTASSTLGIPVSSTDTIIDSYSPLESGHGGDLVFQTPRRTIYKRVKSSSSQGSSSSDGGSSRSSGSSSLPQTGSRSKKKDKAKAPGMVHIGFAGQTMIGEPAKQDTTLDDTQQWANDNANWLGAKGTTAVAIINGPHSSDAQSIVHTSVVGYSGNKATSVGHAADGSAVNRLPQGNDRYEYNKGEKWENLPPMNQAGQQNRMVQMRQGRQVAPSGLDQGGYGIPPHGGQNPDGSYLPQKLVDKALQRVPSYKDWRTAGSQGYYGPARYGDPGPSTSQTNFVAPGPLYHPTQYTQKQSQPDPSRQRYDPTTGQLRRMNPATGREMTWNPYTNRWEE